jgi:hypothetical protein
MPRPKSTSDKTLQQQQAQKTRQARRHQRSHPDTGQAAEQGDDHIDNQKKDSPTVTEEARQHLSPRTKFCNTVKKHIEDLSTYEDKLKRIDNRLNKITHVILDDLHGVSHPDSKSEWRVHRTDARERSKSQNPGNSYLNATDFGSPQLQTRNLQIAIPAKPEIEAAQLEATTTPKHKVTFTTSTRIVTMSTAEQEQNGDGAIDDNVFQEPESKERPASTSSVETPLEPSPETKLVQEYLTAISVMQNVYDSADLTAEKSNNVDEIKGQKVIINNEWDKTYAPTLQKMIDNKANLSERYLIMTNEKNTKMKVQIC